MIRRWLVVPLLSATLMAGCAETPQPLSEVPAPTTEPAASTPTPPSSPVSTPANTEEPKAETEPASAQMPNDAVHGALGDGKTVALIPEGAIPEPYVRPRRRMDLDQLDATIRRVSDGIGWTEGNTNLFVQLSETLGKPDYIEFTLEDLSASTLFQKFLGDAARSVCTKMLDRELNETDATPILLQHVSTTDTLESAPDAVEKNLRALHLRFHGRSGPADGSPDPALNTWRWLFETATMMTNDPTQGWRTVCVGLMTHPFFYSY